MKKLLSLCMVVFLAFAPFTSYAQSDIALELNGMQLRCEVPPVLDNGTTLVPARVIFEAFGIDVIWSEEHQAVYADANGIKILFKIGSDKVYVNDVLITAGTAPVIKDGRTLVPVRVLCEALGCTVSWNESEKKVVIKTRGYVEPPVFTPVIDASPAYAEKKADIPGELITLINRSRNESGLGFVQYDEEINSAALSHSMDMVARDYYDHEHPDDGVSFDKRLENAGIDYEVAYENLGLNYKTSSELFNAWMNSPAHKAAILNPNIKNIGLGRYDADDGSVYWTLILVG